jgi:hypothetical protein
LCRSSRTIGCRENITLLGAAAIQPNPTSVKLEFVTVITTLYAFLQEHRRCGELERFGWGLRVDELPVWGVHPATPR